MSILARLDGVELAQVRFHLQLLADCPFPATELLRLRRELLFAAQSLSAADPAQAEAFLALLDPSPPIDPVLRRRVQKPSPPFAFTLPLNASLPAEAGTELLLEAILPGCAVPSAILLAQLLIRLGASGLLHGQGRFTLSAISACGHDGAWAVGWRAGMPLETLSLSLLNLGWLLEERLAPGAGRRLRFVTPARLLSHGRPLFRIDMDGLAPFLLRRVTAVLATAARIEPWDDADTLLAAVRSLPVAENRLTWTDWRVMDGADGTIDLGGVTGSLLLPALPSEEVEVLLLLASLFNIGRGASFGAGHFALECTG